MKKTPWSGYKPVVQVLQCQDKSLKTWAGGPDHRGPCLHCARSPRVHASCLRCHATRGAGASGQGRDDSLPAALIRRSTDVRRRCKVLLEVDGDFAAPVLVQAREHGFEPGAPMRVVLGGPNERGAADQEDAKEGQAVLVQEGRVGRLQSHVAQAGLIEVGQTRLILAGVLQRGQERGQHLAVVHAPVLVVQIARFGQPRVSMFKMPRQERRRRHLQHAQGVGLHGTQRVGGKARQGSAQAAP
jgi:hypothetical protein